MVGCDDDAADKQHVLDCGHTAAEHAAGSGLDAAVRGALVELLAVAASSGVHAAAATFVFATRSAERNELHVRERPAAGASRAEQ